MKKTLEEKLKQIDRIIFECAKRDIRYKPFMQDRLYKMRERLYFNSLKHF